MDPRGRYSRTALLPAGRNGKKPKKLIGADGKLAEPDDPCTVTTKDIVNDIMAGNPSPSDREAATPPERKRKEAETHPAFEIYREIIKVNICYDILMQDMKFDGDRLDEIVDIMLETVCTRRKTIRIARDNYPAELVKAKFMNELYYQLDNSVVFLLLSV